MDVASTLNENLLQQSFGNESESDVLLEEYKLIASSYAKVENSIAVLSDLKLNKSYIYAGGAAMGLGITFEKNMDEIDSIWEEKIFNRIHPDDLTEKHLLELRFFHLLKNIPVCERQDFHIISNMRMKNNYGEYTMVTHRMFYVSSLSNGSLWLALCLYNYSYKKNITDNPEGIIINSRTGEIISPEEQNSNSILSNREKEILQLIDKGMLSKEIAGILSISINTVNRHRQNILEKLRVKNSIEACRIAKRMGLI